jgi:hypothetical protein
MKINLTQFLLLAVGLVLQNSPVTAVPLTLAESGAPTSGPLPDQYFAPATAATAAAVPSSATQSQNGLSGQDLSALQAQAQGLTPAASAAQTGLSSQASLAALSQTASAARTSSTPAASVPDAVSSAPATVTRSPVELNAMLTSGVFDGTDQTSVYDKALFTSLLTKFSKNPNSLTDNEKNLLNQLGDKAETTFSKQAADAAAAQKPTQTPWDAAGMTQSMYQFAVTLPGSVTFPGYALLLLFLGTGVLAYFTIEGIRVHTEGFQNATKAKLSEIDAALEDAHLLAYKLGNNPEFKKRPELEKMLQIFDSLKYRRKLRDPEEDNAFHIGLINSIKDEVLKIAANFPNEELVGNLRDTLTHVNVPSYLTWQAVHMTVQQDAFSSGQVEAFNRKNEETETPAGFAKQPDAHGRTGGSGTGSSDANPADPNYQAAKMMQKADERLERINKGKAQLAAQFPHVSDAEILKMATENDNAAIAKAEEQQTILMKAMHSIVNPATPKSLSTFSATVPPPLSSLTVPPAQFSATAFGQGKKDFNDPLSESIRTEPALHLMEHPQVTPRAIRAGE